MARLGFLTCWILACGSTPPIEGEEPGWGEVSFDLSLPRPAGPLSSIGLVRAKDGVITHHPEALPYELNTALFSDFAIKSRAIYLPPGTSMTYDAEEVFELPVGTILAKTFSFAPDLRAPDVGLRPVETRLLVRYPDGWRAFPFVWRADGADADYVPRGDVQTIELIDPHGEPRVAQYLVPQRNQCTNCHERATSGVVEFAPIGVRARHLNREGLDGENQLERWARRGALVGLPAIEEIPSAHRSSSVPPSQLDDRTLERAARDYLDINCAHCHSARAVQGKTSQLFLDHANTDRFRLGVCKEPGSAGPGSGGLRFDIVPGEPSRSILWHRVQTEEVGQMMPLVGRSLRDDVAVELIGAWISRMERRECDAR